MKPRPAPRAVRSAAVAAVEGLESRRLLAAFLGGPSDRDLTVYGSNGTDSIELRRSGGDLVVSIWSDRSTTMTPTSRQTFAMTAFDRVNVYAFGGGDAVWVHNAEAVPNLRVDAGAGNDEVNGSISGDTLIGGAGRDTLRGLAGNDQFFTDDGTADTVIGGSGTDAAVVDGAGRDAVSTVETPTAAPGFATVEGSTLTVNGTGGADVISLRGGIDFDNYVDQDRIEVELNGVTREFDATAIDAVRLLGHGGADTINLGYYSFDVAEAPFVIAEGGDGNDFFEVYEGYNTRHALYGGAGDDIAYADGGSVIVPNFADGGSGTDTVQISHSLTIDMRTMANVENAESPGSIVIGNGLDNRIVIKGDGGTALGGDGNDTIIVDDGGERVTLDGGAGDDYIEHRADLFRGDAILDGGEGTDTLIGGGGDEYLDGEVFPNSLSAEMVGPVLQVAGTMGADTIELRAIDADTVRVTIWANSAMPTLVKTFDSDYSHAVIAGFDGDDVVTVVDTPRSAFLIGGSGDDRLQGPDAGGLIIGGPGNDTLLGGAGRERFEADDGEADTVDGGAGTTDEAKVDTGLDTVANVELVNGEPVGGVPVVKEPTADATVRYGGYANQNFGNAFKLQVKENPDSSYDRSAYLTFSLNGISPNAAGVTLRLHGYVADSSNAASVTVHGVSNTTWSESGITAANAPAYGGALGSTLVDAIGAGNARYFEWDVTEYVRQRVAAGATAVSFAVRTSANIRVDFTSGEETQDRPQLVAQQPAGEPQVVTRRVTDDAFARGGTNANTNYGAAPFLEVKSPDSFNNRRIAYLRFDLSGLAGVSTAVLRLYGHLSDYNQPTAVTVYSTNNAPWGEQTLTWNTAPTRLAGLTSQTVTGFGADNAAWYEFDVTSHVVALADAGATSVTFAVVGATNSDARVVFQSDENANRPELVIET